MAEQGRDGNGYGHKFDETLWHNNDSHDAAAYHCRRYNTARQRNVADGLSEKGIVNMPLYCRLFGNRLILLGLIAGVCAYMSMTSITVDLKPVIVFGLGIAMCAVLMISDHKRCSK